MAVQILFSQIIASVSETRTVSQLRTVGVLGTASVAGLDCDFSQNLKKARNLLDDQVGFGSCCNRKTIPADIQQNLGFPATHSLIEEISSEKTSAFSQL